MEDKNLEPVNTCPVCHSTDFSPYITTKALMHHTNDMFSFSHCQTCESAFLNPRVTTEQLKDYYPDYYLPYRGAEAWGKYKSFVENSQRKMDANRRKTCQKYQPSKEGKIKLLDVGCGRPTFLQVLQEKTDWLLTGIDFTNEGWKDMPADNLHLITGDVQQMRMEDTYDMVTMWHYLEHDYDPNKTLSAIRKIINTGGRVIIEVPDYLSLTAKKQKANWEGWHTPRHTLLYSGNGLARLFGANGYKLVDYYRYGTLDAFTLWWMGTMEKKNIDWTNSMEKEFFPLVWKKIYTSPLFMLEKLLPLGIQTVVAEAI